MRVSEELLFPQETHADQTSGLVAHTAPREPVEALEKRHVFVSLGSAYILEPSETRGASRRPL